MKLKIFTNCFLVKTGKSGKPAQICLAMKKRGFGAGMWNGSGGKPQEAESVSDAAAREVQEELSVKITKLTKMAEITFALKKERLDVLMHVFFVEDWEGSPKETEEMKPEWFNVRDVPYKQMWKGDKEWLPILLSGRKIKARYTYTREGGDVVSREIRKVKNFI